MTKILLVEDDNNLREIYAERLGAEGYDIVAAHDGEEALAVAVKEKPDIIISDVMMPKISGFDMLDILRSTPEIKDTKVIMMTALSQADDKARADKLGADKYLVKSQVTLEDVARVVKEMINQEEGEASKITEEVTAILPPTPVAPMPEPVAPVQAATPPAPAPELEPLATPLTPSLVDMGVVAQATEPVVPTEPVAPVVPTTAAPAPVVAPEPIATPVMTQPALPQNDVAAQTTQDEQATVTQQINDFAQSIPSGVVGATDDAGTTTVAEPVTETSTETPKPFVASPVVAEQPSSPAPVQSILTSPPAPVDGLEHEKKVVEPNLPPAPDIHQLYEQEMAHAAAQVQTPGLEITPRVEVEETPAPTTQAPPTTPAPAPTAPGSIDPASIAL